MALTDKFTSCMHVAAFYVRAYTLQEKLQFRVVRLLKTVKHQMADSTSGNMSVA